MIEGMAGRINELKSFLREALFSAFLRNARERRLSLLLWLSLFGFAAMSVWSVQKGIHRWKLSKIPTIEEQAELERIEEQRRQKEYLANLGNIQANLGVFEFYRSDAEPRPPGSAPPPNVMMELVVRCDSVQTCDWVREHKNLARDEVFQEVRPITQEDALTVDGKKRLKKRILQRLNQWMPEGQLDELYFSRVMVQ